MCHSLICFKLYALSQIFATWGGENVTSFVNRRCQNPHKMNIYVVANTFLTKQKHKWSCGKKIHFAFCLNTPYSSRQMWSYSMYFSLLAGTKVFTSSSATSVFLEFLQLLPRHGAIGGFGPFDNASWPREERNRAVIDPSPSGLWITVSVFSLCIQTTDNWLPIIFNV